MVYLIFLFLGTLGLVLSIRSLRASVDFLKNAERATGRVIELVESSDDGETFYRPVFEFTAKDQQQYHYRHHKSSAPSSWEIGNEAVFIFDPADPGEARMLGSAMLNWPATALAVSMTLLVTGLGYVVFRLCYPGLL